MRQTEIIRLDARVVSVIADAVFRTELGNGHQVVAHAAREDREKAVGIGLGDRVRVDMSPYDMSVGQLVFEERRAES